MKSTLAQSFSYGICLALFQYSCISNANDYLFSSQSPTTININSAVQVFPKDSVIDSENFTIESTKSALDNIVIKGEEIEINPIINEVFSVNKTKYLQLKIDERFKTGLYSLKNNYVLSSRSTLITDDLLVPNLAQQTLFQYGRFRTETGYNTASHLDNKSIKGFLHSAYSLINHGRFDLSVTASLESIDTSKNNAKSFQLIYPYNSELSSTSTTIGVIGSFDLSNRWSVVGALTSSHISNTKHNTVFIEGTEQKAALIGTTYSF